MIEIINIKSVNYDKMRIEENKKTLSTLTCDLSFLSEYYFNLVKNNILKELDRMLTLFAKDLEIFCADGRPSDAKQQMIDWFGALETFRSVVVFNLKQSEYSFDISKLSPAQNHDVRNLFYNKVHDVSVFIREDLEYTDKEDIPALRTMHENVSKFRVDTRYHWSVAQYGNKI